MTAPSAAAPTRWTTARVAAVAHEGHRLVRVRLEVAGRTPGDPQRAGQHYVLRLRAPDDYTAQRSYSVASDPGDPLVELLVERLADGEVSGHLYDVLEVGDVVEVRGPLGGWFAWDAETPAIAVGGGTGVVPLVAMLRQARRLGVPERLRLVAVAKTLDELPYAEELLAAGAFVALTRENLGSRVAAPPYPEEIAAALADLPEPDDVRLAFVCGSAGFATYATRLLGEAGVRRDVVRVEQYGPTG